MKLGVAQINPTVGDLSGNLKIIQDAYQSLVQSGAELVIFPELVICGYPPRVYFLKKFWTGLLERTGRIFKANHLLPCTRRVPRAH